tara:strand:+ start:4799 stop:6463 length:1665 start_codon:yes stop_codon:yes gene_type:complete
MDLVVNFLIFLLKYISIFIFFFFLGRTLVILFNIKNLKNINIDYLKIFNLPINLFYPILGVILFGNILFIVNFIFPIGNNFLIFLVFSIQLLNFMKKFNFNIENDFKYFIFTYIFINLILLITSFNISFHYDAGFYHLNHQNWLRNSNIIFGFVNIYWPYGIGSIYEYISAALWFDRTFILLHFVNLIFIWFFYSFLTYNLIKSKISFYKYSSLFILIFAILDNFGVDGGRNGYIYIQGVGKQDITLGILFYVLSIFLINLISKTRFDKNELYFLLITSLFLFQIKVSSVIIFFLLIIYIVKVKQNNLQSYFELIKLSSPFIVIGLLWILKTYITTGCFIFPLTITCINNFEWYLIGSTEAFEYITTSFSNSYIIGQSFLIWVETLLSYQIKRTVILNFIYSVCFLVVLKVVFFKRYKYSRQTLLFSTLFAILNITYLIFFGPEPRYFIGTGLFIVSIISFNISDIRLKLSNNFLYLIIFLALFSLPRLDSYKSFNLSSIPTVPLQTTEYLNIDELWVYPKEGDKCWINLYCTLNKDKISIDESNFYKKVYLNQ